MMAANKNDSNWEYEAPPMVKEVVEIKIAAILKNIFWLN